MKKIKREKQLRCSNCGRFMKIPVEAFCPIHQNSSHKAKKVIKSIFTLDEFEKTCFPKSYKKMQEERRIEEARKEGGELAVAELEGKIMAEKVLKKLNRRKK